MHSDHRIPVHARLLACVLVATHPVALSAGAVDAPARATGEIACRGADAEAPEIEPTGTLTLRAALAAALLGNPELGAFACEIRAHEARGLQASLLPNPELRTDVENVAGSGDRQGDEQSETTLRLSQVIELGGKRAKRRQVADLGRDLATWDYEAKRLSILSDTTKAFVSALAAQERLAVAREVERLAGDTVRGTQRRVDAGAALSIDLAQARVAHGRAEMARRRAERDLAAARSALAAGWGSWRPAFSDVSGTLAELGDLPEAPDLAQGIDRNPDVARWAAELAERAASARLAEAGRVPDVTLGAGGRYFSDNGDSAMVLELVVPLPVLHRNQGAIAEAGHRLAKADAERRAAVLSVRAAFVAAYGRLATAHEEALTLRDRLVPHARAALASAEEAYQRGLFHFTQVLATQKALFELREEEIGALEAFHIAAADLERLTGAALDGPVEGAGR